MCALLLHEIIYVRGYGEEISGAIEMRRGASLIDDAKNNAVNAYRVSK